MNTIQILTQTFSIFLECVAALQKRKWVMMLLFACVNLVMGIMYITFGRYTTFALCMVALVRVLVYGYFSYKNIKPNIFVLILFEIFYVIVTVVLWQDVLDLLPMFAILISSFGSWQENMLLVRMGYIINVALYIAYHFVLGIYISGVFNIVELICYFVAIVHYNILHKQNHILSFIIGAKDEKQTDKIN